MVLTPYALPPLDPEEKAILDDIGTRTGLQYRRVGGIDCSRKDLAIRLYPILAEWFDRVSNPGLRAEIARRFSHHAASHMNTMLDWLRREDDRIALSDIVQSVAANVTKSNAQDIWTTCRDLHALPFRYMLLAKLSRFQSVNKEALEDIVSSLNAGRVPNCELPFVAKLPDVRAREWISKNARSLIPKRRLRSPRRPLNISPDRQRAVFSTEVDLPDLDETAKSLADSLGFTLSSKLPPLAELPINDRRWIYIPQPEMPSDALALWLRLEDFSTVELLFAPPDKT